MFSRRRLTEPVGEGGLKGLLRDVPEGGGAPGAMFAGFAGTLAAPTGRALGFPADSGPPCCFRFFIRWRASLFLRVFSGVGLR